jgi:hypothetical protein
MKPCEYPAGDGRCGEPTSKSFAFGGRVYYFCDDHMKPGAEWVTGRLFKDPPKPKT